MHHLLGLIFFSCPTIRRCLLGKFQELMNARGVDVYLAHQPGPDGAGAPGITSPSHSVHLSHEQPFPHLNLSPPPPRPHPSPLRPCHHLTLPLSTPLDQTSLSQVGRGMSTLPGRGAKGLMLRVGGPVGRPHPPGRGGRRR